MPQQDTPTTNPNPVARNANADPKLAGLSKRNMGGGMQSAATAVDDGPDISHIDTATNRAVKIAKASRFAFVSTLRERS